jgi:ABC-2 type transport system ATP-binding protein
MLAASFSEGKTIILSTHMVRDLQSMIDSVLILENRKILFTPTVDQNLEDFFTASGSIPEIVSTNLEN